MKSCIWTSLKWVNFGLDHLDQTSHSSSLDVAFLIIHVTNIFSRNWSREKNTSPPKRKTVALVNFSASRGRRLAKDGSIFAPIFATTGPFSHPAIASFGAWPRLGLKNSRVAISQFQAANKVSLSLWQKYFLSAAIAQPRNGHDKTGKRDGCFFGYIEWRMRRLSREWARLNFRDVSFSQFEGKN